MISPLYLIGHSDLAAIVARISRADRYTYRACVALLHSRGAREHGKDLRAARAALERAHDFLAQAIANDECKPC